MSLYEVSNPPKANKNISRLKYSRNSEERAIQMNKLAFPIVDIHQTINISLIILQ
jgi:hypothetical protein